MIADENRLPEARRRELVRASFINDEPTRLLVVGAVGDADPRARVLALRAAARHGWLSAEQWANAMADSASDVRNEVATLLARMKMTDHVVVTALIAATRDSEALVVDAACFALGEIESREAVSQLIVVARTHDDARCRECAVAALGAIGDERALDTVIEAMSDKPPIRRRAVVALANFEGPRVDAALLNASTDRDWQVRAAVDQLGINEATDS